MHNPTVNITSGDPMEAEAIEDLAEMLSHFDVLLGALTLLMLIAMNAIIVWLNRGNCNPLFGQKNLLLCAMLFSYSAAVTLDSFAVMEQNQAIIIAIAVAYAGLKVSFISFTWVRTREILKFESHPYTYHFFHHLCVVGQISCCAPVLAVSFATGPSRTSLLYVVDGSTGAVVFLLDTYFAVMMGKHLMNRASILLYSKSHDQRQSARFYSIVASHQLAASFGFIVVAISHAVGASFHVRKVDARLAEHKTYCHARHFANAGWFRLKLPKSKGNGV
ncbi:hypothetical protein BJ741DRAFT_650419 [Chytriomyces cf. hyalinus JEL632]|nr:hypothetical protein BJ741DRAFT_650419 [Chytriomyces cf. hyalinus JEL632]